jgi:hypothetical protein
MAAWLGSLDGLMAKHGSNVKRASRAVGRT